MSKATILFDMDGTLSPARKPIIQEFVDLLPELTSRYNIGIVTGSGIDYVKQQALFLFDQSEISFNDVLIMPCNGTQLYISSPDKTAGRIVSFISKTNMIETLGRDKYVSLINIILSLQQRVTEKVDIPITGNFISYRESTLNWSPIGRDSDFSQRLEFERKDIEIGIRDSFKILLDLDISENNIKAESVLGGSTSFDIYPIGWDKTYSLNHVSDKSDVYFFGDKCFEGGNDYSIYEHLNGLGKEKRAWHVTTPQQTVRILKFNFLK